MGEVYSAQPRQLVWALKWRISGLQQSERGLDLKVKPKLGRKGGVGKMGRVVSALLGLGICHRVTEARPVAIWKQKLGPALYEG